VKKIHFLEKVLDLYICYYYIYIMIASAQIKPTYDELEAEVIHLRFENSNLKRLLFGQKRERFEPEVNSMQLSFLSMPVEDAPEKTEKISYTRRKKSKKSKPPSRQALPASLPRHDIIIEPEEDVSGMKKIGEEITEELEFEPGKVYVNRYIRPKYARGDDGGVIVGILPMRPIEKGIPGPGLLAHVSMSKYVDHLPLYRQIGQFSRLGIELSQSTVCGWVRATYDVILPLVGLIREETLKTDYLMADETTIRVLDPGKKGKTHRGFYWVYYDPLEPSVFFDYRKGRGRDGPNDVLNDFKGFLQTDGYTGYDEVNARNTIISLACMAHARRYFVEAKEIDPERANWMLHHIGLLYKIERYARNQQFSYEQRYQERQKNAAVVMQVIKDWLDVEVDRVLPKNPIGKAIQYMRNQWPRLEVYLTDGRLEIDNNLVENAIRPIALGRKNYLFAGSHDGAVRAAAIYTLMANAKLQGVEPFYYLRDVIKRIPGHPVKKLDQLLPKNWKLQFSS
jgi:transposase